MRSYVHDLLTFITMTPRDKQHQGSEGTCQDTLAEWLPTRNFKKFKLMINHLPDEVLIDIFDSYRRIIYSCDWRKEYMWFNLTRVCRRWRAVMFASSSRLDLGIFVGPIKPGNIKTILSSPLPISVGYNCTRINLTRSALWRLHAALKQHDRVREIYVEGRSAWFDNFFPATNCAFPMLKSLDLCTFRGEELKIPDTFLGGPDLSYLHLRYLRLQHASLASISRFLLSAPALTTLTLKIDTAFGTSPETSLLACLQGMPVLCHLDLAMSSSLLKFPSPPSALEDIVPLSKLTYFRYVGHSVFLDALATGLSAPFLRYLHMEFLYEISSPIVHLPRFINEIKKHFSTAQVIFGRWVHLTLSNKSEGSERSCLHFEFHPAPGQSAESIMRMSGALSSKLITVEELAIPFPGSAAECRFYQQFPNVKMLRIEGTNSPTSCIPCFKISKSMLMLLLFFLLWKT